MPQNNQNPDFLSKLASYNAINGVKATFSELKKTARRIERAYNNRPAAQELVSADEFLRIHYTDSVANEVIACVLGHKDCRNCEESAPHHPSVIRRIKQKELVAA